MADWLGSCSATLSMTDQLQPIDAPSWARETDDDPGRWHWLAHERWSGDRIAGYESICGLTMPRDRLERAAQRPAEDVCAGCAALADRPPGAGHEVT